MMKPPKILIVVLYLPITLIFSCAQHSPRAYESAERSSSFEQKALNLDSQISHGQAITIDDLTKMLGKCDYSAVGVYECYELFLYDKNSKEDWVIIAVIDSNGLVINLTAGEKSLFLTSNFHAGLLPANALQRPVPPPYALARLHSVGLAMQIVSGEKIDSEKLHQRLGHCDYVIRKGGYSYELFLYDKFQKEDSVIVATIDENNVVKDVGYSPSGPWLAKNPLKCNSQTN